MFIATCQKKHAEAADAAGRLRQGLQKMQETTAQAAVKQAELDEFQSRLDVKMKVCTPQYPTLLMLDKRRHSIYMARLILDM